MNDKRKEAIDQEIGENGDAEQKSQLSKTWAQDALEDLEDWIEEQGIYLRQ